MVFGLHRCRPGRLHRRFIVKNFGGCQNFIIWTVLLVLTIYMIDNFLLTPNRIQSFVSETTDLVTEEKVVAIVQDYKPKVVEKKKVEVPKNPCDLPSVCPAGRYPYRLKSGLGMDGFASICFNGEYIISPQLQNSQRGFNVVLIDDKTKKVERMHNFDTYVSDKQFVEFLKKTVTGSKIIMLASQDEATMMLQGESKLWLHHHGSTLVDKLEFRDAFVMIGQRGLTRGSAIEKLQKKEGDSPFAGLAELSGCLSVPLGKLSVGDGPPAPDAKQGEALVNCGVTKPCASNSFAVHLYTGTGNADAPKICVNGKYVMSGSLNDAGRGFNMAVVNPKNKDILRVGHFDTYAKDSSNMEIFLEMLNEGDIILAVIHDDASKNINDHVRKLLASFGSTMLEKISFRDVWIFVGQKGIDHHSTLEEIEFAGPNNRWPRAIDKKMCVPIKIKGTQIKPDPFVNKNEARRKFCSKFDGYGNFCEMENIDDALTPAPLTDKTMENADIFKVPIIVVPGLNHNSVRLQLETLLLNPGIKPEMVTVMCDVKFTEPCKLAGVFSFKSFNLDSSNKYILQMEKALFQVWKLYPEAKHVIVLEEEVIVGPDFLAFLSQCLSALEQDDSLVGISGWNENGYREVSMLANLVYRSSTMPGFGFLLKRSFYEKKMKPNMEACCYKRAWDGWFGITADVIEMIVPDVSRVYRRPYEGLSENSDFLTELFNRPRSINKVKAKISDADKLHSSKYAAYITGLLKAASPLDVSNAGDCLTGSGLGFYIPETEGKSYAIYFEQASAVDQNIFYALCKCFKLFHMKGQSVRGLHNGILRFSFKSNSIILVGSSSPYYKHKPASQATIPLKTL